MNKHIATVTDNNQPGWLNIVETAPNVTLPVGTRLYLETEQPTYSPIDMARNLRAGMRTAFLDPVRCLQICNENAVRDSSDPIPGRSTEAPAQLAGVTDQAYSIDADPAGIRARTGHAIRGAMAYGAMNTNPPPDGHWLAEFWDTTRAEALRQAELVKALRLTREAAMRAHKLCYEAMQRHPNVPELADDGELHDAIHDLMRIDWPESPPA